MDKDLDSDLQIHLKALEKEFAQTIKKFCLPLIEQRKVTPEVAIKVLMDNLFVGDSAILDIAKEQGIPIDKIKQTCYRAAIRACNNLARGRKLKRSWRDKA